MRTKFIILFLILAIGWMFAFSGSAAVKKPDGKVRIVVVSSYHRDYLWSQESSRGFCDAMKKFGYFDNQEQIAEFLKNDASETSRVIMKKLWMDSKKKTDKQELARVTRDFTKIIKEFEPDMIFLGDDEAGNYIGSQFLDTAVPMVFWGFNDNPVKYGLVETAERPGHNATGVYQTGYYLESLQLLKAIVPGVKTFAILTDDSPSGRAHQKGIEFLARKGVFPVKLVESVATNDFAQWKKKALELQGKVDAFYVCQYSTLKDETGMNVSNLDVARWYLANIKIPEATLGFFVKHGLFCGTDDSGYKQAYEAVSIAHDILAKGANPAAYATRTPARGALRVNRARAKMLDITLSPDMGIEEYIDEAEALGRRAQ